VPGSTSYGTIRKNGGLQVAQKKSQKVKTNFLKFLSSKIIFLSTYEALIHYIQTSNEKVMGNLRFLGNLSIFLEK